MSEAVNGQLKTVSIKDRLIEQKTLIALVVMIVITAINAVMAVGMTLVILTAGIDLSVGSVLALCGAIGASLIAAQMPVIVAVGAALGAGAILGGISGIIIAKGKVQA
ncbi:ribose ABC transporter permease, partial [Aduncisulcus paluster]